MCTVPASSWRGVVARRHRPQKTILPGMNVAFLQSYACGAAENSCRASHVNGNIASFVEDALTDHS
jgi:hypothetical protein